jgi:hypothetical protein
VREMFATQIPARWDSPFSVLSLLNIKFEHQTKRPRGRRGVPPHEP